MRLITRSEWGARYGDGVDSRPLPATEAYLHHSVTIAPNIQWVDVDGDRVDDDEERAMRAIEDIGVSRFGTAYGFPYTAAFMPRGNAAYLGHAVGQMGAHTYGRNDTAVGFVLVGNYDTNRPTDAQLDAVAWALVEFKRRGWLRSARLTGGHRDAPGAATACPGRYAYEAIDEINRRAAAIENGEEDDMTAEDRELLESTKRRAELAHYQAILNGRMLRALATSLAKHDAEVAAELAELDKALDEHAAEVPQ